MITITTENPLTLIASIDFAMRSNVIRGWTIDGVGDYTMTSNFRGNRAWFRHRIHGNEIQFGIIGSRSAPMDRTLYSVYHSRLIEVLLTHFDNDIQSLEVSPLLVRGVDMV